MLYRRGIRSNTMNHPNHTVIGIDIGGIRKGFHAVAIQNGDIESRQFSHASDVATWCQHRAALVIAIDAPCCWASSGRSRFAERALAINGEQVQCFRTPTRESAKGRPFYDWVFNGERLYQSLFSRYRLYDGESRSGMIVLETFPHAVVCSLIGRVVPAHPKSATRRKALRDEGHAEQTLRNIDFVDAALCAVTAERFQDGRTRQFGDAVEGFIVCPTST